jgi:hypothetical protein
MVQDNAKGFIKGIEVVSCAYVNPEENKSISLTSLCTFSMIAFACGL